MRLILGTLSSFYSNITALNGAQKAPKCTKCFHFKQVPSFGRSLHSYQSLHPINDFSIPKDMGQHCSSKAGPAPLAVPETGRAQDCRWLLAFNSTARDRCWELRERLWVLFRLWDYKFYTSSRNATMRLYLVCTAKRSHRAQITGPEHQALMLFTLFCRPYSNNYACR